MEVRAWGWEKSRKTAGFPLAAISYGGLGSRSRRWPAGLVPAPPQPGGASGSSMSRVTVEATVRCSRSAGECGRKEQGAALGLEHPQLYTGEEKEPGKLRSREGIVVHSGELAGAGGTRRSSSRLPAHAPVSDQK